MKTSLFRLCTLTLAAAGTFMGAVNASAAGGDADAQARYRSEMAICNSGQSAQDPATCRREARNARSEARRGGLTTSANGYQSNTLQRCSVFKDAADRSDCEVRMGATANNQGSVASGGILREGTTVVPAK